MKTKLPLLHIPLALTPSEASVLLHLIEDAAERRNTAFTQTRINSLRDKVNLALYGEADQ